MANEGSILINWLKEIMEFDKSEARVKGLVDSELSKFQNISFILQRTENENLPKESDSNGKCLKITAIDLEGIHGDFEGLRRFHEQPTDEKRKIYAYDCSRKVGFLGNGDHYESEAANWKDTLF
ncbi:hypothetical protein IFM89_033682 [Coptis chinensis]|uniref:Uncharacterized protein n=1 Tax=Coptis chinensis TaxID=261450 RepID=A0A835HEK5_9MAGN|nr:hypothetical protein IFM89_033682 [Coptis chinensis]